MTGTPDREILAEDFDAVLSANLPWEQFDNSTVVITGAGGLLAGYIVEVLLRRNEISGAETQVVALVRDVEGAGQRFDRHLAGGFLTIERQDIGRELTYAGPADFVIHAASQASPKYYGIDPVGTALPNSVGTAKLLELARLRESRGFLFVSSAEVYGSTRIEPIHETAFGPLDPTVTRSCYAESKRLGETLCISYAHQYNLRTTIARPFHCYGPGMKLDDGRVFADFVASAVHGRDIVLHSQGQARRCFCYISDATRALFTILLLGAAGTAYNVGNPDTGISIRDLADVVLGLVPEKTLKVSVAGVEGGYIKSEIQTATPDITRLSGLGWEPRIGLAQGFDRTIRAYT